MSTNANCVYDDEDWILKDSDEITFEDDVLILNDDDDAGLIDEDVCLMDFSATGCEVTTEEAADVKAEVNDLYDDVAAVNVSTEDAFFVFPDETDAMYFSDRIKLCALIESYDELKECVPSLEKKSENATFVYNNIPVPVYAKDFDFERNVRSVKFYRTYFADPYAMAGCEQKENHDVLSGLEGEDAVNLLCKLAGHYLLCKTEDEFKRACYVATNFYALVTSCDVLKKHCTIQNEKEGKMSGRAGRVTYHQEFIEALVNKRKQQDVLQKSFRNAYEAGRKVNHVVQTKTGSRVHNTRLPTGFKIGLQKKSNKCRGGRKVQARRAELRKQSLQAALQQYGEGSEGYYREWGYQQRVTDGINRRRAAQAGPVRV
ncbi:hypothetical protein AbHV_ORF91 [Abalone herpesvirus Victoria/AUS/2009]|uniref:Uncharacterized protein n=3 Tax=Herpesvirales TaxID=548681 RepID=K4JYK5_ABHV|nr:hypothetical protein AbHV_ORF91 [Abalone herpesvirus Victoria/AUS/2009]ADV92449.1 AbHVp061 [Abalone herpesvirus Victoria/AUS/2007]AFU90103.1 hypothetical protein AbHV_ORF91 [Abalone herpesvirus Victoria/AUS/2009]AMW36255.1 hypothetical protein tc2005_p111c [Abalone herpesvirus Taiwan/2005]UCX57078.1 hypothetical protein [Haliotid herpesvirus 1]